jgi:3-isopropylmalate dehydratase small subunit
MKNKNLLIWASDLSPNTGEGILAINFLNEIQKTKKYKNIKIKTLENSTNVKNINFNKIKYKEVNKKTIYHKYFGPIYGAIYIFFNSHKSDVLFLNYLPFWNFIVFLIIPSKTILGPITGGVYSGRANNLNLFVRKYFFPLFYMISKIIIYRKFKKIIFSTNILKDFIKKDKSTLINFVQILFNKKNYKTKKIYDIIFYNRNHETKFSDNIKNTIVNLSKYCRICVIGDDFNHVNIKNFGWVQREKALKLMQRSKLAFNSAENFLSIFGIDCINNGILVVYDNNIKSNLKYKNSNYIPVNFNNTNVASAKILRLISTTKFKENSYWWSNIQLKKESIRNFLFSF